MLKMNEKIIQQHQMNVEFHDPKELTNPTLMTDISNLLDSIEFKNMEPHKENSITQWNFYIIDGYSYQTKQYLEAHLKTGQQDTRTLLVINGSLDTNVLKYLLLPINGIVSLTYLSSEYRAVLDYLSGNSMFLQQGLHKNLSKEVDFKKCYSKPIKQFILNKNKITVDLSNRDYQVLQLLLDGHSNSEIAEKMHFARSTVSTIISSLLKKMEASDRTDATVKTIRNGWVDCYR